MSERVDAIILPPATSRPATSGISARLPPARRYTSGDLDTHPVWFTSASFSVRL
jgi:hypothetical protein